MLWLTAFFVLWAVVFATAITSVVFRENPIEGFVFAACVAAAIVGVVWVGHLAMQATLSCVS